MFPMMGGCPTGNQSQTPQMGNSMMMPMNGAMPMGGMPMGFAMNPMMMAAMPCGAGMPMMGAMPCAFPCAMGCFPGMAAAMPMAAACCGCPGTSGATPSVPSAPALPPASHVAQPPASQSISKSADHDDEEKDGMSSEQRAVVVRALKEIAAKESEKKKAEKAAEAPAEEKAKAAAEDFDKIPRCHLHKKPNAKCKKCQQVLAQSAKEESKAKEKEAKDDDIAAKADAADVSERKVFNCSTMLKDQILKSSYFKSLVENCSTLDALVQEIPQSVDTLDVYNPGSKTQPSCFFCCVYRLFTFPNIFEDELNEVISHDNPFVRCVGFAYIRFVYPPNQLLEVLEDFLYDDMEIPTAQDGDGAKETIGEFVESLLIREKYFDYPMPRIPVKARQAIEEKIAPMPQFRKRMQANRKAFKASSVEGTEVEVNVDGEWLSGKAQELLGKQASGEKLRVLLDSGADVKVPLGKVVLKSSSSSDESGSEDHKQRRRSRSPRRRGRSPDWSRYKGKSDAEMLQELRERARDGAVCSHKTYQRRPETSGASTAPSDPSGTAADGRRRGSQEEDAELAETRKRLREEEERQRRMQQHDIFTKYCAQSSAYSNSAAGGNKNDIEGPSMLRLG
mmetsp:Transcript_41905/g.98239  ORF Transcript_41905/g.98239 Transcript_41905/m.98239 type:complete len:620 (+) Transcript_41905:128-1987(+)